MNSSDSSPLQPHGRVAAAPARDPRIAESEEFSMAKAAGTIEALDAFLARHPDGVHADEARLARMRLLQTPGN